MKRLLFAWLFFVSIASAGVTPGMKEEDLLAAQGTPSDKAGAGARIVYRWGTQIVVVENGTVTKVTTQPVPAPNFQTPWQDESHYVVTQVAADLAEMGYFLKNHSALPGDTLPAVVREIVPPKAIPGAAPVPTPNFLYRVTVKLGPAGDVTVDLPLATGVWLPANYRPLTQAIAAKLGLASTPQAADLSSLLQVLCNPSDAVLAATDRKLSASLATHFDSAALHEQAALLLDAFALRENSGLFYQIRVELCRATAHLAWADQLRGKSSETDDGRVAAAALATLYGNQLQALELLKFPSTRPETQAWQRALQMRNTSDFRPLENQLQATLLEQREWFHARCLSVSAEVPQVLLERHPEWETLPDWTRTLAAENHSIQTGHFILETALKAEAGVWQTVYPLETDRPWNENEAVTALNVAPTRCVDRDGVHVLGWGLWAATLQREFCHIITTDYNFLEKRWGVPDQAQAFRAGVEQAFGGLTLFPFVRRLNASEARDYRRAQQEAVALVHQAPQLIPANAWNHLSYAVSYTNIWMPPPGHAFLNEWHRENPLPGTVYDIAPRMNHRSLVNQPDAKERLTGLHRLAPYGWVLSRNYVEAVYGKPVTSANFRQAFAPIIDYTPELAAKYAQFPDLTREERNHFLVKSAMYLPRSYKILADILIRENRPDEAAGYYAKWISLEPDRVAVAASCRWMVRYLESHGQTQDATDLAEAAATVYSAEGLATKALLLESRHDYSGALAVWKQLDERYGAKEAILGWAIRTYEKTSQSQAAEIRNALLQELAPDGLKKLTPDDLAGPPNVGVVVSPGVMTNSNPRFVTQVGLKVNDIIVGLRGYQVTNFARYKLIRGIEPDESSVIKVWRDGTYLDLPPVAPGYRYGMDLPDYRR